MTPSRSRVRIDRIDLDLVYYTLHLSMGKRVRERQPEMWVATTNFPTAASHPFYTRLNQRLAEHYFDDFVEGQCVRSASAMDAIQAFLISAFLCSR